LFTELLPRSQKQKLCAVINTDDPWGKKLAAMVSLPILSYGSQTSDFQFQIKGMQFSATEFTLKTAKGEWTARVPLLGRHNVYNVTAAIAAASAMGVPAAEALQSLCTFSGVPGRMQSVPNSRGLYVYVDYAHTPDALEKVLLAVQDVRRENKTKNAIVAVFGCGGDRDRGKRTVMLQTALQCADRVVLTSDNPRSEDPQQIINDCLAGLREQVSEWKLIIEIERRAAIRRALSMAQPGDVIMIAGKGHENYQIVGNQRLPFSDFETAQEFLA
jgi:UDP-N-acetylmuramoyl-L-alanyl-D-glutamate--2,6-diaminopimelate ligase